MCEDAGMEVLRSLVGDEDDEKDIKEKIKSELCVKIKHRKHLWHGEETDNVMEQQRHRRSNLSNLSNRPIITIVDTVHPSFHFALNWIGVGGVLYSQYE